MCLKIFLAPLCLHTTLFLGTKQGHLSRYFLPQPPPPPVHCKQGPGSIGFQPSVVSRVRVREPFLRLKRGSVSRTRLRTLLDFFGCQRLPGAQPPGHSARGRCRVGDETAQKCRSLLTRPCPGSRTFRARADKLCTCTRVSFVSEAAA